uniref:NADH-ubiquinone oxidoreductase chain 6 n=1 Tax=Furcilarnaca wufengensis TaxID=2982682 RepID=A0A977T6U4_9ORTH|nr:NADH dehydrogenase subunit 6 [Furcilarnaca wufengensis]UXP34263.1 NADH dehydrogenase subunit 6 [Furcilarnaca wufengensis]UXP34345.1 NADH dehydrogenase subunit 6 [Furcilarnaca wufengensis]
MTMITFMMLNLFTSIMFIQCNHPLTMTLIIIVQTILISLSMGLLSQSFWFSYILFLVFLGGMLILFIYTTALASNEILTLPSTILWTYSMIILLYLLNLWWIDPTFLNLMTNNPDMIPSQSTILNYWSETIFPLMKLYNNPTNLNTLMLMMYLFLTLIAIVKITNIFSGPLRPTH